MNIHIPWDDMKKINGLFTYIKVNYKDGRSPENMERDPVPEDGVLRYSEDGKEYYFKFHHDYIDGYMYVVYDSVGKPVYYFSVGMDDEGENWDLGEQE